MPLSRKHLAARGLISPRQMTLAAQKGTRSQPSKMAHFDAKRKGEGSLSNKGVLKPHEINHPERQNKGGTWGTKGYGPPTKGARAGPEGQFNKGEIDNPARQKPAFPKSGSKLKGKYTKPAAIKGTKSQRTGNVYDTPDRNGFR
jgi:hypothetical protein